MYQYNFHVMFCSYYFKKVVFLVSIFLFPFVV